MYVRILQFKSASPSTNPNFVSAGWCAGELNTCPLLCGGTTNQNTCDSNGLTYQCTCGNGSSPDTAAYTNTLPFYICQQVVANCVAANPMNAAGQTNCRNQNVCGNLNADTVPAATSSASSASSSASATSSATASPTTSTTASPSASKSFAMSLTNDHSPSLLVAGILAAFGWML
ncbi:MAG: hypothetical protein M1827_003907 [Pycnora praestabilis]|nr:MAG: hypothetical protein M1827_003907 [Pycnora praestabilis]